MPLLKSASPRLAVRDLTRASAFYRDQLGFVGGCLWPEVAPTFTILERDGVVVQLSQQVEPFTPTCVTFVVDDCLGWHAQLKDHVKIEWGPEVYSYGCREFAVCDPDGNMLIFSEETSEATTCNVEE